MTIGMDIAEHVRRELQLRIEALLLARKLDADLAQRMDAIDLFGNRAVAQIGGLGPAEQLEEALFRCVGEDFRQLGSEHLAVADQLRRHHPDGIAIDRARQRHPIAIDDIAPPRIDQRAARRGLGLLAEHADKGEPQEDRADAQPEQREHRDQADLGGEREMLALAGQTDPVTSGCKRGH